MIPESFGADRTHDPPRSRGRPDCGAAERPLPPMRLRPVNNESFVTASDEGEALISFVEFPHGHPGYLLAGRAGA